MLGVVHSLTRALELNRSLALEELCKRVIWKLVGRCVEATPALAAAVMQIGQRTYCVRQGALGLLLEALGK